MKVKKEYIKFFKEYYKASKKTRKEIITKFKELDNNTKSFYKLDKAIMEFILKNKSLLED